METGSKYHVYQEMRTLLNEKQWRHYLAMEARERGSVALVAAEARASRNIVKRGLRELETGGLYQPGEPVRQAGGGRKKTVERDGTLLADLESLLEPKGDPMSLLQWTSKSLAQLVKALHALGQKTPKIGPGRVACRSGLLVTRQ